MPKKLTKTRTRRLKKPVGSAIAKPDPMTECDNCGESIKVSESHSCETCGATLCNQCICEKCD